jgi:hypothetical protein
MSLAGANLARRPDVSSTKLAGLLIVVVASVAAPRASRAQSVEPPRLFVEGQIGSSTPIGRYGLSVDATVARGFSLSAGVGEDALHRDGDDVGIRYAFMSRYHVALDGGPTTLSFGLGLSYGKRPPYGDAATRLDAEISIERLFDDGVRVRAFGGFGRVLDPNPDATTAETNTLYAGVALGYAVVPNPAASAFPWSRWYGWQNLGLDAVAALLGAGHDLSLWGGNPLFARHLSDRAAIGVYAVGSPMVHLAHHNYGRIAASIGVRLLGIATGALLGARSEIGDGGGNLEGLGAVTGAVAGALVDDLALAWDWRTREGT